MLRQDANLLLHICIFGHVNAQQIYIHMYANVSFPFISSEICSKNKIFLC